jgi:large subunit ribosomal protein L17
MFDEIAPKYVGRTGGYTKLVRIGQRRGDGSEMAILMFV